MIQTASLLTMLTDAAYEGRLWSPIPGASRYLVSDCGEVVSLVRHKPRTLRPISAGKYNAICLLHDNGRAFKRYIHRIVLETFCGPAPDGMETRHLDGNRYNNRVENLRWGTRLRNHADKRLHGTDARGERNPQAKLTREQAEEMRRLYATGQWTFKQLAARYGVTTMTAHRAVRRVTWN